MRRPCEGARGGGGAHGQRKMSAMNSAMADESRYTEVLLFHAASSPMVFVMLILKNSTPPNLNQPCGARAEGGRWARVARGGCARACALRPCPVCPLGGERGARQNLLYLDEVALRGRAKAGEEGAGALLLNDLLEAANEALVVLGRVQLDARLHDVHRREGAVGDAAADPACERAGEVVLHAEGALTHDLAVIDLAAGDRGRHHLEQRRRETSLGEERHIESVSGWGLCKE